MSNDAQEPAPPTCPRCGGPLRPIAYGFPGPEMFEAAERGEIVLGGCVVFDDQPRSTCVRCEDDRAF